MQQVVLAYDELDFGFFQFDFAVMQQQAARTAFYPIVEAFRRGEGTVTGTKSAAAALDQANVTLVQTHAQVRLLPPAWRSPPAG